MRMTKEKLAQLDILSNKVLNGDASKLNRSDLSIAIMHVRWLTLLGETYKAENWHRRYRKCFADVGLTMPEKGKDGRAAFACVNGLRGGRPLSKTTLYPRRSKRLNLIQTAKQAMEV